MGVTRLIMNRSYESKKKPTLPQYQPRRRLDNGGNTYPVTEYRCKSLLVMNWNLLLPGLRCLYSSFDAANKFSSFKALPKENLQKILVAHSHPSVCTPPPAIAPSPRRRQAVSWFPQYVHDNLEILHERLSHFVLSARFVGG